MKKYLMLLACLLPVFVQADTTLNVGDDIEVRGRPVFDHNVFHGYIEYRFTVINHSLETAHRVNVQLVVKFNNSAIEKEVVVPPHGRMAFSMFADRTKSMHEMTVIVDNRKQDSVGFHETSTTMWRGRTKTALLASRSINQDDLRTRIENIHGWSGGSRFPDHYDVHSTDLPPAEWSDNWLAYSSFDGILMTAADLEAMHPRTIAALQQYTEAGGVLAIAGNTRLPMKGRTVQLLKDSNGKKTYVVGFGRCYVQTLQGSGHSSPFSWLSDEDHVWSDTGSAFRLNTSTGTMNQKLPVVDKISIPVRGFLLLVTLFALVAGPITVLVLARTNRRIWLLWVVPLEAAIACGIVLGYSFLSEGITPTVRLSDVTLLDQGRHQATTLGWAGYYCPQRPSDGLLFPEDWELNTVKPYRWRNYSPAQIDWTRGQHITRGWVESRVPTFLECRRSTIRRERIEVSANSDGSVEIVNGLGADIESLWLRDTDGTFHFAEHIKAGQRVGLKAQIRTSNMNSLHQLRTLFTRDFSNADCRLFTNPSDYMVPGSYVAVLSGAPFMDHGLGDRKLKLHAREAVYGLLPTEEQP